MVQTTKLNFIIPWSLAVIMKIRKAICLIGQNILPWSSLFSWNFSRVKDSLINLLTCICYYLFLLSFPFHSLPLTSYDWVCTETVLYWCPEAWYLSWKSWTGLKHLPIYAYRLKHHFFTFETCIHVIVDVWLDKQWVWIGIIDHIF